MRDVFSIDTASSADRHLFSSLPTLFLALLTITILTIVIIVISWPFPSWAVFSLQGGGSIPALQRTVNALTIVQNLPSLHYFLYKKSFSFPSILYRAEHNIHTCSAPHSKRPMVTLPVYAPKLTLLYLTFLYCKTYLTF